MKDADEASDDLPANSAALLIAFENTWAERLVEACRAADGFLIDRAPGPSGERSPLGRSVAAHRMQQIRTVSLVLAALVSDQPVEAVAVDDLPVRCAPRPGLQVLH